MTVPTTAIANCPRRTVIATAQALMKWYIPYPTGSIAMPAHAAAIIAASPARGHRVIANSRTSMTASHHGTQPPLGRPESQPLIAKRSSNSPKPHSTPPFRRTERTRMWVRLPDHKLLNARYRHPGNHGAMSQSPGACAVATWRSADTAVGCGTNTNGARRTIRNFMPQTLDPRSRGPGLGACGGHKSAQTCRSVPCLMTPT